MGVAANGWEFVRQVNCLTSPERAIVEAFRVLVFGALVNPMPRVIYDLFWSTATWAVDQRRASFEASFPVIIVTIDGVELVLTRIPDWFIAYNDAVESGDAPVLDPCPCDGFP
jgi:hypothetical protein